MINVTVCATTMKCDICEEDFPKNKLLCKLGRIELLKANHACIPCSELSGCVSGDSIAGSLSGCGKKFRVRSNTCVDFHAASRKSEEFLFSLASRQPRSAFQLMQRRRRRRAHHQHRHQQRLELTTCTTETAVLQRHHVCR